MFFTEARKYQAALVSVKGQPQKGTEWILIQKSVDALCASLWLTMTRRFGAQRFHVIGIDVVTLNHAIESLAIDGEDARCRLFVAASVFEYACDVTPFDHRQGNPVVIYRCWI